MFLNVLNSIIPFASCRPARALWEVIPGSKCWGYWPLVYFSVTTFGRVTSQMMECDGIWLIISKGFNALFDFVLAIMPVTVLYNLQMKIKKKIGLGIVLGLGIL